MSRGGRARGHNISLKPNETKDLYSKKDMNLGRFNIDCM
jgi:hypothetical protein